MISVFAVSCGHVYIHPDIFHLFHCVRFLYNVLLLRLCKCPVLAFFLLPEYCFPVLCGHCPFYTQTYTARVLPNGIGTPQCYVQKEINVDERTNYAAVHLSICYFLRFRLYFRAFPHHGCLHSTSPQKRFF